MVRSPAQWTTKQAWATASSPTTRAIFDSRTGTKRQRSASASTTRLALNFSEFVRQAAQATTRVFAPPSGALARRAKRTTRLASGWRRRSASRSASAVASASVAGRHVVRPSSALWGPRRSACFRPRGPLPSPACVAATAQVTSQPSRRSCRARSRSQRWHRGAKPSARSPAPRSPTVASRLPGPTHKISRVKARDSAGRKASVGATLVKSCSRDGAVWTRSTSKRGMSLPGFASSPTRLGDSCTAAVSSPCSPSTTITCAI